ncbi:hypothetical protein BGW80DRAFT_221593 [Lactifluus volemus]|nr:hypothetical protein BGW80DRAFT_221593 [Lactifluus volemus]
MVVTQAGNVCKSPPSGVSPPPAYSSPPLQVQIPQPYITPSPPSQDSNIKPHYSPPSNPRQQSQQYPPPPFPPTHARTVPPVLPIHSNTPQIAISPSSQGSIHPQQPPHHSQVQPLVSPSQPQLQPQPHAGGNRFPPPQFPPPSHVLSSRTQYPDSSSRQAPLHGGPVPSNPTHLHSPPENRSDQITHSPGSSRATRRHTSSRALTRKGLQTPNTHNSNGCHHYLSHRCRYTLPRHLPPHLLFTLLTLSLQIHLRVIITQGHGLYPTPMSNLIICRQTNGDTPVRMRLRFQSHRGARRTLFSRRQDPIIRDNPSLAS